MSQHEQSVKIVEYLVSKNIKRSKAFDVNKSIQKLLASIFIQAEKFALHNGTTIHNVGVSPNVLMTPSGKNISWQFIIKDKQHGPS